MKKILFALLFALCFTPAYSYWGVGVKCGVAPRNIDVNYGEKTDSHGDNHFKGVEFIYQYNAEIDALALSIGFNKYADLDLQYLNKYYGYVYKGTEEINDTYSIPLSVAYKYRILPYLLIGAGTGVTFFHIGGRTEVAKYFPHFDLGAEWMVFRKLSLGIDFVYNMNSTIKNNNNAKRDIDGISTSFSARVYF